MKKICSGLLLPVLWALCGGVHAECSRSDVDYFLEKGFTRAQVTAICESAPARERQPRYQAHDAESDRARREEERREIESEDRRSLEAAIAGWDVKVTPDRLDYTHKICLSAGSSPDVTARIKVCPEVKYRIYFAGLDIKGAERRYIAFGRREIEVEGKIKRKLMHDFKEYGRETRRQLLGSYRARTRKGATFIPIRKDYPLQRITEILRRYVNRAG